MKQGIADFNAQKYWECHEALEDVWNEEAHDPVRNVYWAIIQVACSLIHYRDGQIVGASGMLNKAKEKFKRCETLSIESPLLFEFLSWKELKELVFNISDNPELAEFKKLFQFRFDKYPFSRFEE